MRRCSYEIPDNRFIATAPVIAVRLPRLLQLFMCWILSAHKLDQSVDLVAIFRQVAVDEGIRVVAVHRAK